MKHILFLVLLAAILLPLVATAQPTTRKDYADSLSNVVTDAGSLAYLNRGYGSYKYLKTDIGPYKDKMLAVILGKKTDSLQIQGGFVDFGQDTIWTALCVPVMFPKPNAQIATASGVKMVRDTCVSWISDVGIDKGTKRIVDMSGFFFPFYRVTLAPFDSTKTYIKDIRRGGY